MSVKTYRELVNEAISECKVTTDPLTALNFDDPPRTFLYNNFKRWVNKAYRDLMLERQDWFFRVERTTLQLSPRLHLVDLAYIPQVGDVLVGQASGVEFTITAVHTFETNEESTGVERTVDVSYNMDTDPRNFETLEALDRVSPVPLTDVGVVRNAGRYNFAEVEGFDQMDMDSVKTFYDNSNIGSPLIPIAFPNWVNRYSYYPYGGAAFPEYITRTPDGNYELFPQPIEPFFLEFAFSRTYNDMVLEDDIPVGVPEKYQDILVWKTVAEFSDYDNNSRLFSRANKNIEKYNYFLNRDTLPTITFAGSRFNY